MKADRYRAISTDLGWFGLVASGVGVKAVVGPEREEGSVREQIAEGFSSATELLEGSDARLDALARELIAYSAGKDADLSPIMDIEDGTPFQRSVWLALREIPKGEVMPYGEVAEAIGKPGSARAVGQAVGANPLTIVVPCHRVVGSDGALTGFGGGLDIKVALLVHEGRTDAAAQRTRTERRKGFRRTRRELGRRRGVGATS